MHDWSRLAACALMILPLTNIILLSHRRYTVIVKTFPLPYTILKHCICFWLYENLVWVLESIFPLLEQMANPVFSLGLSVSIIHEERGLRTS